MLHIVTDLGDSRWLKYTIEEFLRVNLAGFEIDISNRCEERDRSVIYYTVDLGDRITIPNRSHILPGGKMMRLSEEIFIIQGTETGESSRFACCYDLFWNAFVFLSRLEEYRAEAKGKRIRSYCRNHPRQDSATFSIPVVNHLFDELERLIVTHFPHLAFGKKTAPVIEYSHDVDYVQKTVQLRIKQSALNAALVLKSIPRPSRVASSVNRAIGFLLSSPSYWCFDYWKEIEKKRNVRSVFYFYANVGAKGFTSWLIDPSYTITINDRFQQMVKELLEEGFEIGLHGSYKSATNKAQLSKEKTMLERVAGVRVKKVRQHWLRYVESETPHIHDELFEYDSSLGWNDRMGFRSGIASRYRPYDHSSHTPFRHMETPQVIMDSNVFGHGAQDRGALCEEAIGILEKAREFKSAHLSISWHQRVCSRDYGWHVLYERALSL